MPAAPIAAVTTPVVVSGSKNPLRNSPAPINPTPQLNNVEPKLLPFLLLFISLVLEILLDFKDSISPFSNNSDDI